MKREDLIERVLTYLTFAEDFALDYDEDMIPQEAVRFSLVPLSYFNGAELLAWGEFDALKGYQSEFFNPDHPDNLELKTMDLGMWQHCALTLNVAGAPAHEKATCLYQLWKARKVPLSEVRGKAKLVTGDVVEFAQCYVYNDSSYNCMRFIVERRGTRWVTIWCGYAMAPNMAEDMDQSIYMSKSCALTRYYDWRVEIGFEMPGRTLLPTVSLITDPLGARSAYRLRDVAPGKSRRDALRHWVSTHWRSNHHDPDEEIKIWAHLRGVEEFTHNGLKCRIIPSQYDLKKAAEYQRLAGQKPHERRKVS